MKKFLLMLPLMLFPACDDGSNPEPDAASQGSSDTGADESTGDDAEFRSVIHKYWKMTGRPSYAIHHFTNDSGWTCFYCSSGACNCEPIGGGYTAPDGNVYDGKWYPEIAP